MHIVKRVTNQEINYLDNILSNCRYFNIKGGLVRNGTSIPEDDENEQKRYGLERNVVEKFHYFMEYHLAPDKDEKEEFLRSRYRDVSGEIGTLSIKKYLAFKEDFMNLYKLLLKHI